MLDKNDLYRRFGSFSDEFEGSYFELGDGTEALTFSLVKSFDL